MVLQRRFIFPMIAQGGGEGVVVGVGERVGGVVDQLAQGIVVEQPSFSFFSSRAEMARIKRRALR